MMFVKVQVTLVGSSIYGYEANSGGAVAMFTFDPDSVNFPGLDLWDSTLDGNYAKDDGGGVWAAWGTVQLDHASVTNNKARHDGGGLFLSNPENTGTRDHPTSVALRVGGVSVIDSNTAGYGAAFSTTSGFGGGIYSFAGQIAFDPYQGSPAFQTYLRYNSANEGGAMYVDGPNKPAGGAYAWVTAADTVMAYNSSADKGGAFYSNNAVDWRFTNSGGHCLIHVSPRFEGPCSYLSGNQAQGLGSATPVANGGAAYITDERTDGYSRGIVRFRQTLLEENADANGLAAVAATGSAGEMVFNRDVFVNNKAAVYPADSVLVYNHNSKNVDFRYNTVLDNDVTRMFSMDGGNINVTGSILWGSIDHTHPQHFVWFKSGGATLTHNNCLLIREHDFGLADIPGTTNLWSGFAPDLDSHYVPRGNSPAIDFCSSIDAPPTADIYGNTLHDTPGVSARYGNFDLGAAEQSDVIFAAGFGKRPNNLDYHHEY